MLTKPDEFDAICYVSDCMGLETALKSKGIDLQTIQARKTTKKKPVVIYDNEHQLIRFFSIPVPNPFKRRAVFGIQNRLSHAAFTEDEFEIVLKECQNNEEFMLKCEVTQSEVEKLIENLRWLRANADSCFEFALKPRVPKVSQGHH